MDYSLRKAATVVIIRDAKPGLQVLLLKRSEALAFAPGNWVFPGGTLDPQDQQPGASEMTALHNAAVREVKEETSVSIDGNPLHYFMQFTTPFGKKRFQTWFFITDVDETADVQVDGSEIVEHRWMTAAQALEAFEAGEMLMFVPTGLTLMQLASFSSVSEAKAGFSVNAAVEILPHGVYDEGNLVALYPGDAGYQTQDVSLPGARHRTRFMGKSGRWQYQHNTDEALYPRLDGGYNR